MASQAAQLQKIVRSACLDIGDKTDQVIRKIKNCNRRARDLAYHPSLKSLRSTGLRTLVGETIDSTRVKDASRPRISLGERLYWSNVRFSRSGNPAMAAKSQQR